MVLYIEIMKQGEQTEVEKADENHREFMLRVNKKANNLPNVMDIDVFSQGDILCAVIKGRT